jgi:hypothetical protein
MGKFKDEIASCQKKKGWNSVMVHSDRVSALDFRIGRIKRVAHITRPQERKKEWQ